MKKALLAASLAALLGSTSAYAEGMYIFGDIGQSDFDTGSSAGFSVDETDTMVAIGLGYSFTENFSAEVGYTDLGETSVTTNSPVTGTVSGSTVTIDGTLTTDAAGFFVGLRGDLPVSDSVNLFARAGLLNWESDGSFTGSITIDGTVYTGTSSAELADGTDPYFGIGADWKVADSVSVNAQYTLYKLDYDGADLDVDTLSLGVRYAF